MYAIAEHAKDRTVRLEWEQEERQRKQKKQRREEKKEEKKKEEKKEEGREKKLYKRDDPGFMCFLLRFIF